MGLRQLYFLIGGLLDRLVYLSYGLSIILAFIGVKLVLHALHENTLPFINGGEHVSVPEISTALSLSVIIGVLVVATVASLLQDPRTRDAGRASTPALVRAVPGWAAGQSANTPRRAATRPSGPRRSDRPERTDPGQEQSSSAAASARVDEDQCAGPVGERAGRHERVRRR